MSEEAAIFPQERAALRLRRPLGRRTLASPPYVNALVGTKISIVTHKVQDERAPWCGGSSSRATLRYPRRPSRHLRPPPPSRNRANGAERVEPQAYDVRTASCLLVDARRGGIDTRTPRSSRSYRTCACRRRDPDEDRPRRPPSLLSSAASANEATHFDATFMLSAQRGDGESLPEAPPSPDPCRPAPGSARPTRSRTFPTPARAEVYPPSS